jgi:hypothetical protein
VEMSHSQFETFDDLVDLDSDNAERSTSKDSLSNPRFFSQRSGTDFDETLLFRELDEAGGSDEDGDESATFDVIDGHPPSKTILSRLGYWCRAHPFISLGISLFLLSLLAGLIVFALLWPLRQIEFSLTRIALLELCQLPLAFSVKGQVSNPATVSVDLSQVKVTLKFEDVVLAKSTVSNVLIPTGNNELEINASLAVIDEEKLAGLPLFDIIKFFF